MTMQSTDLQSIDWSAYRTAYGVATTVPDQLRRLASANQDDALKASHDLWCGLCHQHAYVSSAALPALPFLLETLRTASDPLAVEILDILLGFATCTSPAEQHEMSSWEHALRHQLKEAFAQLAYLQQHSNHEIVEFAEDIAAALEE